MKAVEALPAVNQQVIRLGMLPGNSPSPDKLRGFISSEIERWGKLVAQTGLAGSVSWPQRCCCACRADGELLRQWCGDRDQRSARSDIERQYQPQKMPMLRLHGIDQRHAAIGSQRCRIKFPSIKWRLAQSFEFLRTRKKIGHR